MALGAFFAVAGPIGAYAVLMEPHYESTGTVWVEEPKIPIFQDLDHHGRLPLLLAILRSRNLASSVADVLPRKAYDDLLQNRTYTDWRRVSIDGLRRLARRPVVPVSAREQVITELLKARMTFSPNGDSRIIQVTASASDPSIAADIATAYIETLQSKTRFFTREEFQAVREFLENQAKRVEAALRRAEGELGQYQRQRGAVQINGTIARSLASLSQAESAASATALAEDIARTRLAALKAQLERRPGPRKVAETIVVPPTLKDLLDGWQAAAAKVAGPAQLYTYAYSQVRPANEEARRLWRILDEALQRHLRITVSPSLSARERAILIGHALGVAQEIGRLQTVREAWDQQVRAVHGSVGTLSHEQNEFARRGRAVEAAKGLHDLLSTKAKEADFRFQEELRNVRVLDPPMVPTTPSGHGPAAVLLLGVVLGVGVALTLPFALEFPGNTMKAEEEAEAALGWRVLGTVPPMDPGALANGARPHRALAAGPLGVGSGGAAQASARRLLGCWGGNGHGPKRFRRRPEPPLCIFRNFDPKSRQAEQYRSLRTALRLVGQRKPFQTLLLTSLGPREGKSTMLINLAFLFWEAGQRVLVVDGDLRGGCLHWVFGAPQAPGITDLVLGKADTLFPAYELRPGLFLIPRGRTCDKPEALLGSAALQQVITLFRERADIILIDSSPLLPVSDVLNLVSVADGVLLVVREGYCSRSKGARARQLLQEAGANVLGLVVNEAKGTRLRGPAHFSPGYYDEWDDVNLDPPARGTGTGAPEPNRASEPRTPLECVRTSA